MPDPQSYELTRLIKRLYGLLSQNIDLALRPYGLARTQYIVLYNLRDGGVPTKQLLEKLQVEGATLSGIVDTLEAKGLVERVEHPEDKRRRNIVLTKAGRQLLEEIPAPAPHIQARMLQGLEARDVERFQAIVDQMIQNLKTLRNETTEQQTEEGN